MADLAGAKNYPVEDLRNFTLRVLTALGVPEGDAAIVANSLIEANLRGVDTHGITRLLGIYIRRLQTGIVNKDGNIAVEREGPSSLLVDGRNCLARLWRTRRCACVSTKRRRRAPAGPVSTTATTAGRWPTGR